MLKIDRPLCNPGQGSRRREISLCAFVLDNTLLKCTWRCPSGAKLVPGKTRVWRPSSPGVSCDLVYRTIRKLRGCWDSLLALNKHINRGPQLSYKRLSSSGGCQDVSSPQGCHRRHITVRAGQLTEQDGSYAAEEVMCERLSVHQLALLSRADHVDSPWHAHPRPPSALSSC